MSSKQETPIYDGFPCTIYDEDGTPVATMQKHPDCPLERYNEFLSLMFRHGDGED